MSEEGRNRKARARLLMRMFSGDPSAWIQALIGAGTANMKPAEKELARNVLDPMGSVVSKSVSTAGHVSDVASLLRSKNSG